MALAGPACAQSSVTLYGIIDTGVSYYNNAAHGGSFTGMPTLTGEVPSRWGCEARRISAAATRLSSCSKTVSSPAPAH